MTDVRLSPERYFESIDNDTERMLTVAERGLEPKVPSCEGWVVADVVSHTGEVYEHKVRVMADNAWPDPWPPAEFEGQPPIDFLRQAKTDLFEEFSRHEPSEETTTFGEDTTIAFWIRRMALEAAVHRYDVELAHGDVTPVADDIAVDGIDEVLRVMLEVDETENVPTEFPVDALVAIEAGGERWLVDLRERSVTISSDQLTPAVVTVSGDPQSVYLWLWGRVGDDRVNVQGDRATSSGFRSRLVESTQ